MLNLLGIGMLFCILLIQYDYIRSFCIRFFNVDLTHKSTETIHLRTMISLLFIDCLFFWCLVFYAISYDVAGKGAEAFPLYHQLVLVHERRSDVSKWEKSLMDDCSKIKSKSARQYCVEMDKRYEERVAERNRSYPIAETIYDNAPLAAWVFVIYIILYIIFRKDSNAQFL